jgi:hypothetical protein
MAKTMIQQFQENRKETAEMITNSRLSKSLKNELGKMISALVVSAYATGYAQGSEDWTMTTEGWGKLIFNANSPLIEILNDINFDFHALGGI